MDHVSNNLDCTFDKSHALPFTLLTLPSPLLAVLRMNLQAITQYCKVPQASREAARASPGAAGQSLRSGWAGASPRGHVQEGGRDRRTDAAPPQAHCASPLCHSSELLS